MIAACPMCGRTNIQQGTNEKHAYYLCKTHGWFSKNEIKESLLENIVDKYSDGILSRLDGIAIDYPDWRFSIRTSNTEPLIRLNVEGKTEDIVTENLDNLKNIILESGATLKE